MLPKVEKDQNDDVESQKSRRCIDGRNVKRYRGLQEAGIESHRKLFEIPSWGKKGENMGCYWIFPGISQFGKMQQYPFMAQEKPKIFPVMGFS